MNGYVKRLWLILFCVWHTAWLTAFWFFNEYKLAAAILVAGLLVALVRDIHFELYRRGKR